MNLTEEQKAAVAKAWAKIMQVVRKVADELKRRFIAFGKYLVRVFIGACMKSDRLRPRALIYLHTKNRRIKRKQFKWLVKTAFGGRTA